MAKVQILNVSCNKIQYFIRIIIEQQGTRAGAARSREKP
jgi:hypothetical protein